MPQSLDLVKLHGVAGHRVEVPGKHTLLYLFRGILRILSCRRTSYSQEQFATELSSPGVDSFYSLWCTLQNSRRDRWRVQASRWLSLVPPRTRSRKTWLFRSIGFKSQRLFLRKPILQTFSGTILQKISKSFGSFCKR